MHPTATKLTGSEWHINRRRRIAILTKEGRALIADHERQRDGRGDGNEGGEG